MATTINDSQPLPLAPAEASHGTTVLAVRPSATGNGIMDAAYAYEFWVATHENKLACAAPPTARRALPMRYRHIVCHRRSFRFACILAVLHLGQTPSRLKNIRNGEEEIMRSMKKMGLQRILWKNSSGEEFNERYPNVSTRRTRHYMQYLVIPQSWGWNLSR